MWDALLRFLRADQEETPPSLEQPLPRPTLSLGIKARGVELPQEKIKYVTETNATRKIVPLKFVECRSGTEANLE